MPVVPDPMDGALATSQADAAEWVTTYGVPALVAAIIFGTLLRIGFRWLTKVISRTGRA